VLIRMYSERWIKELELHSIDSTLWLTTQSCEGALPA
jgi:hypothetical protein